MVDIDGGIGALFVYSSKGGASCPTTSYRRQPEQLGRGGTFVGQHVYTSRPGVAVFIDAFNFPVWGMLEKLAPAVLAGVPAIVKPASPDGVRHRAGRPAHGRVGHPARGSVQLLCGSPAACSTT